MPIGLDPSPVDCRKNASTRMESRGISRKSFPWRSSRYSGMRPARRSIPPVRPAMLVAIGGACPPCPLGDGCALGDCAGARLGVGARAGVECVHAAAMAIAAALVQRAARMSVELREEGQAVGEANIAGHRRRATEGTGNWELGT